VYLKHVLIEAGSSLFLEEASLLGRAFPFSKEEQERGRKDRLANWD
jgi:hypothetical protein